ncbi:MAG: methyltransferase domain-containing protein [Blastocatellia bacterium]
MMDFYGGVSSLKSSERSRRVGITINDKVSSVGRREKITAGLDLARLSGLEIGPLTSPVVRKSDGDITYIDHVGTEALRTKYSGDIHVDPSLIVDVDVIWEGRDLPTQIKGGAGFDYIIACHVIEHVPDLVHWLSQLRSALKPEGVLRLVVPDRRFTFDRLRRETQLSDVIDAWLRCAARPSPLAVLDHGLNYREIDAAVVWRNGLDRDELNPMLVRPEIVQMAREVLEQGTYRDVHCWVFTPQSLGELFTQLCELRLLGFACEKFEDTEYGELEFMLTMRPSNDQARTKASWRQVAATAFEASLPANDDGTKTRREFTSGA